METSTDASKEPNTAHQLSIPDIRPTQPGPYELKVQNITAKVFLNRPAEDLIPVRYLRMAESTPTVQRKAWIFRGGAEDARTVNLKEWSKVDIRYRGVFKTLTKVPRFSKGLWDGGCEACQAELDVKIPRTQGQVVYALLNEIGDMLNLRRHTANGKAGFFLRPRLLTCQMEYWTGYRQKHKDGPYTAGFLSLDFEPDKGLSVPILPVSTTMEEESLISSLDGKFKLMLGQLLLHIRPLQPPGDKLPDQEIFLLGLHGSKLHIMRAFFPGQKTSSLWCRRELPGATPVLSATDLSSSPSSPTSPHATHIEYISRANETTEQNNRNMNNNEETRTSRHRSNSNTTRFYTAENIEQLRQHLAQTKLSTLDNEPNLRTFRVLATKEYDLWLKDGFNGAVHALVALHLYLLSGEARCGALMDTFARNPYHQPVEVQSDSEEERQARLRQDVEREELLLRLKEEELAREEELRKFENEEKVRVREAMRWSEEDRISSLRHSRQPWWDFVWKDSEGEEEDEEEEEMNEVSEEEQQVEAEMDVVVGNVVS